MIEPRPHLKNLEREINCEPSRLFKIRLDRNERNMPFSEAFVERIRKKLSGELLQVYPELNTVYSKLAVWLGVSTEEVMLHSGSDQAIKAVFETYIDPGDRVLFHSPGYGMYEVYAKMFQAKVIRQSFDSELHFSWDDYIEKITPNVRMVVVENPNGYLGVTLPLITLKQLVEKAARFRTIVLIDEAYFHFHEESALPWIKEFDQLILTRTFSKAFGLAGIRAGYLVSQKENIQQLKKVRPVYEITGVSALIVDELLDSPQEYMSYVRQVQQNRENLQQQIDQLGLPRSESRANFVTIKLGDPRIHESLREVLAKDNILIRRPFREGQLKEWVRINAASTETQNILVEELKKLLKPVA